MGGLIFDASAFGRILLPDEADTLSSVATERLLGAERLLGPGNLRIEVASLLRRAFRMGRLTRAHLDEALTRADRLTARVEIDTAVSPSVLSACADRYRLSVYDAAYVELALRTSSVILTADGAMHDAASRLGILA